MNLKDIKKRISKFFGVSQVDEDGNKYLVRRFNKPQLIGAIIRASSKVAYRVVGYMDDEFCQEVVKIKRR